MNPKAALKKNGKCECESMVSRHVAISGPDPNFICAFTRPTDCDLAQPQLLKDLRVFDIRTLTLNPTT